MSCCKKCTRLQGSDYENAFAGLPLHDAYADWLPLHTAGHAFQGARDPVPDTWPEEVRQLVHSCWHQDPNLRPDFGTVYRRRPHTHVLVKKFSGA
eukprot:scaffold41713_cov16-Tisochrysis_lutea.AAC.1